MLTDFQFSTHNKQLPKEVQVAQNDILKKQAFNHKIKIYCPVQFGQIMSERIAHI